MLSMNKLLWMLIFSIITTAWKEELSDYDGFACSGMYSNQVSQIRDSKIQVNFPKKNNVDVTFLIYNWLDESNIGIYEPDTKELYRRCSKEAIEKSLCESQDYGKFLFNNQTSHHSPILTNYLKLNDIEDQYIANYPIEETGLYCVELITDAPYTATIWWHQPYGELMGSNYPRLVFYGTMAIIYFIVGLLWGANSFYFWKLMHPVQHYLSLLLFTLILGNADNLCLLGLLESL